MDHSLRARIARLRRLAWWLDDGIAVPGTRRRIGLDPVIGLIPGFGDAAGAAVAGWLLLEAAAAGVSNATILRMALNLLLDATCGAVPVLGDLFDLGWKANSRNIALLERHLEAPGESRRADRRFLAAILGVVAFVMMLMAALSALLVARLVHLVRTHV